ncbi:MAG: undecaprenyl/decaprenyl-phosphate alpha-N-acetylglucosaminyl 1-phosphate transferase, partial [Planctomycetes bacterium]|nr:undecaprenyl/decaprenyl-phosphate alpha-N-acetylglucosaminyl 1-phosphate transferase [Planctomycetota bacterium]
MEFSERVISVLFAGGLAFITALTTGVILVSVMCRLSRRWGALDRPDGTLKCHVRPTATLGGIPLFIALLMGLGVLVPLSHRISFDSFQVGEGVVGWLPIVIAGLFILWVGVKDDLHHVAPRSKVFFQIMASMVLIGSGLIIGRLGFFGVFEISLGVLAFPFTLFWLVGSCNAFNFIDGMDGLASGIGVVIALFLAGFGIIFGAYGSALLALALAGGLVAILLFNFKPAIIFVGGSGSQLVGLLLGALVIEATTING